MGTNYDTAAVAAFIADFEALRLPRERWTHEAHLTAGLWYLWRAGHDGALLELRRRIRLHNQSVGTPNTDDSGYHETITQLYVDGIAAHAEACLDLGFDGALASLLASPLNDPKWPLNFYSRDELYSVQARREWLPSTAWERAAQPFIRAVQGSTIGMEVIRRWAKGLRQGAALLDLGCGPGSGRSDVLAERGAELYALDAAPTFVAAYQTRYPHARVRCETIEGSDRFDRHFDAVIAWGLLFLLPGESQRRLIERLAQSLTAGGRLLFTAPAKACAWFDLTTGQPSRSLGARAYAELLCAYGLVLQGEYDDDGDNHYYDARRP
ncbi:MAG: class I SAM-dependent methyltransferase [Steroidobacteraceae bacterium]